MLDTNVLSKIPEIQSFLDLHLPDINRAGIMLSLKKEIPYGSQIVVEGQFEEGMINVYFSKKRGISFVDCSKNSATREAIIILTRGVAAKESDKREQAWNTWIGTDESGKGDFFGPLVVAGFVMTRAIEEKIISLGVMDSKRLSSKRIREIAKTIRSSYGGHISVVAPSVEKYNELYTKFKNLNSLLAWGHARVIENLAQKYGNNTTTVDGVISDKFGNERLIKNALKSMSDLTIVQRPRGESNSAVAVASIIARDTFEQMVENIQKEIGYDIPFGAGNPVLTAAKKIAQEQGKEIFQKIAKVHFKTINQI